MRISAHHAGHGIIAPRHMARGGVTAALRLCAHGWRGSGKIMAMFNQALARIASSNGAAQRARGAFA